MEADEGEDSPVEVGMDVIPADVQMAVLVEELAPGAVVVRGERND